MGVLLICAFSRLLITEVMSNVRGSENTCGSRNEYVEIHNLSYDTVDLAGYHISDFDCNPDEIFPWENDTLLVKYPKVRTHSTRIYPNSYALIMDRDYVRWDSVNWQPYDLPDSTLILTTDDHTIGDGLSTNDPLILFSTADSCTTSFGTPWLDDGFPSDPGDGVSWERIELNLPDTIDNWHPSLDSSGGTPGRENSTVRAYDLALDAASISFIPAQLKPGDDLKIAIWVKNKGLRLTADYKLSIFDDENKDSVLTVDELLVQLAGRPVAASDSVAFEYVDNKPGSGDHRLAFRIDFLPDKDPANNVAFKDFTVSDKVGLLTVTPSVFTPNADHHNDFLQIDYRLPAPDGILTISVYDSRGKKIHDICHEQRVLEDRGMFSWNGEGRGVKIPTGMYVIYLEYKYQNRVVRAKRTAVLAR
jgi:hypothetical protein